MSEAAAVLSTSEPASQAGIDSHGTDRDRMVWAAETQTFIAEGQAIIHDAKTLGGTIGVSCERQRVTLRQDMIK